MPYPAIVRIQSFTITNLKFSFEKLSQLAHIQSNIWLR